MAMLDMEATTFEGCLYSLKQTVPGVRLLWIGENVSPKVVSQLLKEQPPHMSRFDIRIPPPMPDAVDGNISFTDENARSAGIPLLVSRLMECSPDLIIVL